MREKEAFWIVIRNLRKPLLVLIVTYGLSALILTMAGGVDSKGNPHNLSFFDAFYIISYTATTIGYGEIPFPFTYPQRMALVITIYLTVPAWFYAIGKILQLVQDKTFQTSIKHITFKKQIARMREDFIIICGYNTISKLMIEKFQSDGVYRVVILDKMQEKIDELKLEDHYPVIPAIAADATLTSVLAEAGVTSPYCKALVTLFEDDDINLKVAVKSKILNQNLMIIAESSFSAGIQNLQDVGVEHVIDPYSLIANRVEYMLNAPFIYALLNWLGGASLYTGRKGKLNRGKYIICSRGRLGKAVKEVLLKNGIEYEIVDILKETKAKDGSDRDTLIKAGIAEASCLIAGTPDDAVNLSIILTARKIRPDIYIIVRENKTEENSVFAALRADKVFIMDKIIAIRAYNIIARPLVVRLADTLVIKSDAWAERMVERLTELINKKPIIEERVIAPKEAYALSSYLDDGNQIMHRTLISNVDGNGRALDMVILGVLHSDGEFEVGPSFSSYFRVGDTLLLAGTDDAIDGFDEILNNVNKLHFVLTKEEKRDWIFEKFLSKKRVLCSVMKNYEDGVALAFVTLVSLWQYDRLDPVNIALLYIFPILLTAIRRGSMQAFVVSLFSIVLFNFLFVPPRFSLTVAQPHFLFTFSILVIVGQVVAYLANEAKRAKELETSEITKDAILSSLSHELRTPLSAVMGASSSLLDPSLKLAEEQRVELVESIHDGSIRIHGLMENLLNMARLENGKLKPNKINIDPVELMGTVIGKFDYDIAKNIDMRSAKCRNIDCDASLLELALVNILENAIKYGSDIQVFVRDEGAYVLFEISNTTTLALDSDLSHIFTKFGRLPNSASEHGVGLGLAICKAIADIHGGKITAKVDANRFTIKLYIP